MVRRPELGQPYSISMLHNDRRIRTARPARRSRTLTRSGTKLVLRHRGRVAGLCVVAARGGGDVAITAVVLVARAIFGKGG
jgi:hypothetical protein